jgi:thiol-disulfide isomerase/thioredoxin
VAAWVSDHPPSPAALRILTGHLETSPDLVAEAVAAWALPAAGVPAPLTADALHLRSDALARAGREAEAAREIERAVALDDGTRRLAWSGPGDDDPTWSVPIDAGSGRLVAAARRLLVADRRNDALPLLGRAAALGAPEAIELLATAAPDAPLPVAWPGEPLRQVSWGPPLPAIDVPLYDGGRFPLATGEVVLVDFWASWCQPCQIELPLLQALYEAQSEAGLRVIAVNVHESADVALPAAEELGLTMPIGEYTPELAGAFRVEALPTIVVADRYGKVRRRWNGYERGVEREIADTVRALLAERGTTSFVEVATVLKSDVPLEVSWVREGPRAVQALAVLPAAGNASGTIAVASRDDLAALEGDGAGRLQHEVAFEANRLAVLEGPQGPAVAAFRRGSDRLFTWRPAGDETWSGSVPSPVFDLSAPASRGGASLLATFDGLMAWDGAEARRVGSLSRALAVVALEGEQAAWAALDESRSLVWLDAALEERSRRAQAASADALVTAPGVAGAGVVSAGLLGAASGRAGSTAWVAVAAPDRLVVVDARDGRELFRAAWPGIAAVASGDVDGDGRDEIVVGSGAKVSLMRLATEGTKAGDAPVPAP